MNADPEVMRYFPTVLTRAESDALVDRIEGQWAQRGFTFYAAELPESAEFIGFIGISEPLFEAAFTPCVEIGWRLAKAYWGQGLAPEGAQAVLHHAFTELGLTEIVALTVPANLPSRRVMEKIGMAHDPADDFDHPGLPEGHPLRRHVLYRIQRGTGH
jgi:RimJ/RimL family protein N-acetyltransferase